MSIELRNLEELGDKITVSIPCEDGFLGRECPEPDCLGYFKLKPGTGLKGSDLPCHCPYCGHSASMDNFWTPEQLEYGRSVAFKAIHDALGDDLKSLEFDQPARGPLGIGISLEFRRGSEVQISRYREKELETLVICSSCTLEYAIYGVFAFCPDCGSHNSLQILEKNVSLIGKQANLSQKGDDAELSRQLLSDALSRCVSSLDGFGRETCRVRAGLSISPEKSQRVSFQNIDAASERLVELFGVDLRASVPESVWNMARKGFMKRHVIAHRSGVVDQQYVDETSDHNAMVGRMVPLDASEVAEVALAVSIIGQKLIALLPSPPKK